MVERVVRDFVGISADRRREVTTLLLHAALNPATFYGGEGDACFYGRLDTTGETDFEVLSRRGILLSVAFSAEPNRGSPVRSQTSAGRSELEVAAMTSLIEFRPDEWPLCATDPKEGEEAELAYLHAVGRAAKFQLPFLVVVCTADTEQADGEYAVELLWPKGSSLGPLVKRLQDDLYHGRVLRSS